MEYYFDRDWSKTWEKIKAVNANFFTLAKSVAIKKRKLKVTEIEYNFGDEVMSAGKLTLPIADKTKYSFGIVLESALEAFVIENGQIASTAILKPGQTFLISNQFKSTNLPLGIKNITAGARSIFLLPKITDSTRFWRLSRKHKLKMDMPRTPYDQWEIFKNITNHSHCPWRAKVLLFTEEWLKNNDSSTKAMINYLLAHELPQPDLFRKKDLFQMVFSKALSELRIKAEPYLIEKIKHLFAIASGLLPAFTFAQDESLAPIKTIQKAFTQDYKLSYAPHIVQPGYCNQKYPTYYSMQMPGLITLSSQKRITRTKLEQLKDVHSLLSDILTYISKYQDEPIIKELGNFEKLDFKFFDSRVIRDSRIDPSTKMKKFDSIIQKQSDLFKAPFCESSSFMSQGCISVIKRS